MKPIQTQNEFFIQPLAAPASNGVSWTSSPSLRVAPERQWHMAKGANNPAGKVPVPDMRRGIRGFFEDVKRELKRVIWPSRTDTVRLTGTVLIVCVLFILYLWTVGYVVDVLIKFAEGINPFK
jgi:preprotein translocase SecE subunit